MESRNRMSSWHRKLVLEYFSNIFISKAKYTTLARLYVVVYLFIIIFDNFTVNEVRFYNI